MITSTRSPRFCHLDFDSFLILHSSSGCEVCLRQLSLSKFSQFHLVHSSGPTSGADYTLFKARPFFPRGKGDFPHITVEIPLTFFTFEIEFCHFATSLLIIHKEPSIPNHSSQSQVTESGVCHHPPCGQVRVFDGWPITVRRGHLTAQSL